MSSIDNTEITKRNRFDQRVKIVSRSLAIVLSIWAITMTILYIQIKHTENANAIDYTLVTVEDYYVARTLFGTNESTIDIITDDTVKANATFHQKIHVGNRRIFNSAELSNFELLMQSFTSKFVTANNYDCLQINSNEDINDTIITLATVKKQLEDIAIDDTNDEDTASNNTTSFVINLVYVVSFESIVCNDVKYYPLLFQNYTNGHLDIVLRDLQILDLNVTQIEKAKRPVYNK